MATDKPYWEQDIVECLRIAADAVGKNSYYLRAAEYIEELRAENRAANAKGHRAITLCMEAEDREMRLASQLIRAEKERDIVVGILTQARSYIDSPRFDEEGEFTGMVDEILRKMT